jgi:hypothetical protein
MSNVVMLLGKSGTGKSTSVKTLNPKETIVLNVLGKRLPFKGSSSMYSSENKNLFQVSDYAQVISLLKNISEKAPHVKNVVLDDAIYIMRKEFFERAKEVGYNKFTELGQHFQMIINTCEKLRSDLNMFLILHSEDVVSDNSIVEYKVSTIGKMLDNQYNPIEVVPMVLYSSVIYDDKGVASYGFYTHRHKEGTIVIPAKTPDGMFEEEFIPNDLQLVVNKMNEYYG